MEEAMEVLTMKLTEDTETRKLINNEDNRLPIQAGPNRQLRKMHV